MASPLESAITLEDVFAMVTGKRVPLAPELAGYLSLEIAEKAEAGGAGGDIDPRSVYIADEGTVALVRPRTRAERGGRRAVDPRDPGAAAGGQRVVDTRAERGVAAREGGEPARADGGHRGRAHPGEPGSRAASARPSRPRGEAGDARSRPQRPVRARPLGRVARAGEPARRPPGGAACPPGAARAEARAAAGPHRATAGRPAAGRRATRAPSPGHGPVARGDAPATRACEAAGARAASASTTPSGHRHGGDVRHRVGRRQPARAVREIDKPVGAGRVA